MATARRRLGGAGASNTAALAFGGSPDTAATEAFNGAGSPTTVTFEVS